MASKVAAIMLVTLMGAVAAYDIHYFKSRGKALEVSAADGKPPAAGFDAQADDEPRHSFEQKMQNLPAVFQKDWVSPFREVQPKIVEVVKTQPTPAAEKGPFAYGLPRVSAVLVLGDKKSAVIDGNVVRVGDVLPAFEAEVTEITPAGVRVKADGRERFLKIEN